MTDRLVFLIRVFIAAFALAIALTAVRPTTKEQTEMIIRATQAARVN
jgi:hypothetical protein